ncbi:MAG TPA: amidohydrolase family protein [Candidatus Binataceae bacterium]|jgi:N-acyl-D-aspartate/D-glutamate deacylase|nr:amidohydrolase family protein [Candidatus Binataceae bacterium]
MPYDLLIKGGTVVDGTGAARFAADVAIAQGRITEIGKSLGGPAGQVIDATDLIVAPGFVDPHTHYDAQICWDPQITSSSWHGVTSVILGSCGVGVAPCKPADRDVTAADLTNLEAIPFDVLQAGLTWDWDTFPSYMDAAARRRSAINLGFFAPLTPFRHWAMGRDSLERGATPQELERIRDALRGAMEAGALGISTSVSNIDIGYEGKPLACRKASRDELKAYCHVLRGLGKGVIQLNLADRPSDMSPGEYDTLEFLLNEAQRPVSWISLFDRDDMPQGAMDTLDKFEPLIRRGGVPQISCRPLFLELNLRSPLLFITFPCVQEEVFNRPFEVQKKLYADPGFRQKLRGEIERSGMHLHTFRNLDRIAVQLVNNPALKKLEGKDLAEIARQRGGVDGLDLLLDLALEDDLEMRFVVALLNNNKQRVGRLVSDPRTIIALSDGGAHVDQICDAGYCTYLLGTWVREEGVMSLEQGVKRITSEPADFFGIKGRGRVAAGAAADLAVFDPNTVGSAERGKMRNDLPGGARRLVMEARGIHHTVVNGVPVYENGNYTGALPGQVLRS